MTTITREPDHAAGIAALKSHLHPVPSWLPGDHRRPSGREETWRFTPVERFAALLDLTGGDRLDWLAQLPAQVTGRHLGAAEVRQLSFDPPVDLVAANAVRATGDHGLLVEVPAGAELAEPVVIELPGSGEVGAGLLIVRLGHHARATVVLRHHGLASFASKVEIQAGDHSGVDIVSVQDWAAGAVHGGQFSVQVGTGAQVRTIQASVGAGDVRLVERVEYTGPGGTIEQLGIYFVRSGQHIEHRMLVDHAHPHTESHVDYRGALQGAGAHSVWIGDVLIRRAATDIETYESNKNLMLTEGCRADSVPNLEIETGEIRGAGHSSSTGRFDDEQLFYLRSRGIPEEQARRLVVEGFFLDIIRRIGVPQIEERLAEALNAQLASVAGITSQALLADDAQERP